MDIRNFERNVIAYTLSLSLYGDLNLDTKTTFLTNRSLVFLALDNYQKTRIDVDAILKSTSNDIKTRYCLALSLFFLPLYDAALETLHFYQQSSGEPPLTTELEWQQRMAAETQRHYIT